MSEIIPAILAKDEAAFRARLKTAEAVAPIMQVDVMDGHFVPNISIGPDVVKALRPHSKKTFDVHLMISPVDPFLEAFAGAVGQVGLPGYDQAGVGQQGIALVFVAIFGPGPVAGICAVAARSIGFIAKLVAEAIEQQGRDVFANVRHWLVRRRRSSGRCTSAAGPPR